MMKTRLLALAFTLLSVPALAQQLKAPTTITAAGSSCTSATCTLTVSAIGVPSIGINVEGSGTYELLVEGTRNTGTTWFTLNAIDAADPDHLVTSITEAGNYSTVNDGLTGIRVRASTLSSGTPVVTLTRGFLEPINTLAGSGGGGGSSATEYLEGAADASIAGIAMMMEDAGNTLRPAQGSIADGLLVNLGANNDVVETNSAAIAASLSALDNAVSGNELQVDVLTMPTVSVTGTVDLGATDNAVLDNIDADLTTIDGRVDGLEALVGTTNTTLSTIDGRVDGLETLLGTANTSLAIIDNVVFGAGTEAAALRVTVATDSTGVLSVDDNGGSITVDGSISCSNCTGSGASDVEGSTYTLGTDSVAPLGIYFDDVSPTAATEDRIVLPRGSSNRNQYIQIRDGANNERGASVTAQNELLVELGAGAASIGTLGANSGVDIGDVTLTAGSADIGNVNLEIGGTAITAGAGAVGATTPRMTLASDDPAVASLALIAASLSVLDDTGAETADEYITIRISDGTNFITPGVDYTQDVALTVASTAGPMTMGRSSAAAPTGVTADDEAVAAWFLRNGQQVIQLASAGALISGDATNGLDVDVTRMAALVAGNANIGDVDVASIAAGNNNIGDVDVASIAAGDNDIGNVDLEIAGTAIATNAGAASAQTLRMVIANDDPVNDAAVKFDAALIAHDAPDAGTSLPVGYRAIAFGANPTAVAAADRTVAYANRAGVPFSLGGHPNAITETVQVTDADGAQTGTAIVSVSAGTKIVVTRASVKCSNANSGNVDFRLVFDTDGTFTAAAEAGVVGEITSFDGIAPGTGAAEGNGGGILGVGADDEDLRYSMSDPVGGSCTASVTYFTIES